MASQVLLAESLPPVAAADDARWERVRLGLLVGWLVMLAGVLVLGERVVPLSQLDAAVSSGQVSEVRLSPGLPAGATGSVPRSAHWDQGRHRYVATVRQVTGRGESAGSSDEPVIRRDLGARLLAEAPGSFVARVAAEDAWTPSDRMLGRSVPHWLAWARLALYLGTLAVLVWGPQPWRARRWAWFWFLSLFGLQTLGVLAFLTLSGPTPLLAAPRPGRRRLRGGLAFVIALLCAGLGGS